MKREYCTPRGALSSRGLAGEDLQQPIQLREKRLGAIGGKCIAYRIPRSINGSDPDGHGPQLPEARVAQLVRDRLEESDPSFGTALAGLILVGAYPFLDQGRYGRVDMSAAEVGVWFNGDEHVYLRKVLKRDGTREYKELPNIPRHGQRIEDIGLFKRKDLVRPSNLKAVFRDLRNHLAGMTTYCASPPASCPGQPMNTWSRHV